MEDGQGLLSFARLENYKVRPRVAFQQPIITPPPTKKVRRDDPLAMYGCPDCHNLALTGILNQELTEEIGFYCSPCNTQWEFIG